MNLCKFIAMSSLKVDAKVHLTDMQIHGGQGTVSLQIAMRSLIVCLMAYTFKNIHFSNLSVAISQGSQQR